MTRAAEQTKESSVRIGDKREEESTSQSSLMSLPSSEISSRASNVISNSNEDPATVSKNVYSILNIFNWSMQAYKNSIEEIESKIFSNLKTPINRFYIQIRNSSLKIWTLSANTTAKNTPVVFVHGFCGGIGLWVHNIDSLIDSRPVYAFDLLGFGRSSRPSFSTDPIVAEAQFVESIEDWRKEMQLNEFILLGHSFGGYLATAYALKYARHVKALILADPWGFPENNANRPDTPMPLWVRAIAKCSQYVSPLSIFRLTGQIGVSLFKHLRPDFRYKYMTILDNPELIYSYLYYANCLHPSGEAGFRSIAEYFGFAKNPMIKRFNKVNFNIPVWFIYGGRSWIDSEAGYSAVYMRQRFGPTYIEIINGAGHHVYADRPNEFNDYVKQILDLVDSIDMKPNNFENQQQSNCSSNSLSNVT